MTPAEQALRGALVECRKHAAYLGEALEDINRMPPIVPARIDQLSKAEVRVIDQFIFRFTCLQDVLGQKVFKYLLEVTREPLADTATFIDKLRVLERLNLVEPAHWERSRVIRNRLVHEYPEAERRVEILDAARATAPWLNEILRRAESFSVQKLGITGI